MRHKNIFILFLIIFLFLSPLWIANWLYFKENHLITHTTNHGTFITPPLDVSHMPLKNLQGITLHSDPFKGQWTLLAAVPNTNNQGNYLRKLHEMRQIRLMLGKNRDKVQRMLLFYQAKTPIVLSLKYTAPYAGSLFVVVDEKNSSAKSIRDGFFIVDPSSQLMMRYRSDTNPKDIMQDLRRLIESNTHAI